MNNLTLVSFVGVDVHTNFQDVLHLAANSLIQTEFSVLYSDTKSKGNYVRYPSYDFCQKFLDWAATIGVHGSLHLCGSVIERYLKQEQDVMDLCEKAHRIQLNLNIKDFPDHEKLTDDILAVIQAHKHRVILQQNKTKQAFMKVFLEKSDAPISLLHDGSGGFGREISEVVEPDATHFTGYAGGIKPENVEKIVELIEDSNPFDKDFYIDMESGVREDNVFSIEKCRQVLEKLDLV